ncbi:N-acetylneuraminate synthase family protein [Salinibacter ruber]|uniref:N-acetylneuraminate synthase family protein n=1 Tax=Salinibacter ruber TaxID=146919 RepID=UPI0021670400|nr:N-acetylneuraminate synthase family protein [Salinibacter ruber]MCS4198110.1 N-acetylneuraminate synthase/N,N'-diacetyllegionaminate synthase [Salinibacter ruber]
MITIGNEMVGENYRPLVIAEAGTNFGGHLDLGKAFIEEAARANADIVKFQTHVRDAEMAEEAMRDLGYGDLYERISQQEFTRSEHAELMTHCEDHGVTFLSTPYSVEGVSILEDVDAPAIKIGSGELTNYHLLKKAAETNRPLLISTGMADMEAVREAVTFVDGHTDAFALLYCVSAYPTDPSKFNLDLIDDMRAEFGVPIGFSDHSKGIDVAKLAMGRGADFVEKHFTLSRKIPWGDPEVSIEPEELRDLCTFADLCHAVEGTNKEFIEEEHNVGEWAHHSIVANEQIKPGMEISEKHVTTKRPGTGIPAKKYYQVVGKKAQNHVKKGELVSWSDIEQE